jgi:phenylalanyl-tRNA synthetase alpha chain
MASNNNNNASVDPTTIENTILSTLDKEGPIADTGVFAQKHGWLHDDTFVGCLKRLEALSIIATKIRETQVLKLSSEAETIIAEGSPEARVFEAVTASGISKDALEKQLGEAGKIGFSQAMKKQWIAFDKASNKVTQKVEKIEDTTRIQLQDIKNSPASAKEGTITELKQRKLLSQGVVKTFLVEKGSDFKTEVKKPATDITMEMMANGSWKSETFKPYNFNALGVPTGGGHLHPLLKVRAQIRQIFLEMGFEEMPTNNWVESSFWNFDALFQPQQHPARDAHDTFFISDPAEASQFPPDYLERVKDMHVNGGHGSIGWRYDWKLEESKKNILRTHTTAVSSRMLYQLAKNFTPKKYFSIDRVFRNEAMDATHLAEFNQIEGLIADRNLTLANLMGIIEEFFKRLGIENLRFKPAYNPYTEPSMEIFSYHEGLKRWVEIGNSGIFRPEMLLPMGLPPDVKVIAWGLSLERPTMIKYGIKKIRELVGHQISLDFMKNNALCRFDEN